MIGWIIWDMAALITVCLLVRTFLPGLFRWLESRFYPIRERGIRKYSHSEGYSLIYEPSLEARRYIDCFQLLRTHTGKVLFVGRWAGNFACVAYCLSAYRGGRLIRHVHVQDAAWKGQATSRIPLPSDTTSVSLAVHRVDGRKLPYTGTVTPRTLASLCVAAFGLTLPVGAAVMLMWHFAACVEHWLEWSDELPGAAVSPVVWVLSFLGSLALFTCYVMTPRSFYGRQKKKETEKS